MYQILGIPNAAPNYSKVPGGLMLGMDNRVISSHPTEKDVPRVSQYLIDKMCVDYDHLRSYGRFDICTYLGGCRREKEG
jgi:hypothetical protein